MTFRISTSEVATFLTCKQRWMYAHHPSYNLEPRTLGIALTRGVVGHAALEMFYKMIQSGKTFTESESAVMEYLVKKSLEAITIGDIDKANMIGQLGPTIQQYFTDTKWILDRYKIVGVENIVSAPLPGMPDIEFVGRIDLTLENDKGEVSPYDHKFTYNFWSEQSIRMNAQISNYVWALREMGMHSRRGFLNMVRYRDNAIEKFKQEEVPTNSHLREVFINNHAVAAKDIAELKKRETVGIADGVTRSTSKFNCEYCPFVDLCYTEASGLDTSAMRQANYRPNSYGYDNVLDVE
ncbi:PD-(D/E)XK nuclease family protein [Streptomyces sp. NPDC012769]|uniref:PD-(D/E)XK nuclease family protein n=1 Tax=Streptomyces sp. NPDC012769 TaxID=3364848 RepID=UPI0036807D29